MNNSTDNRGVWSSKIAFVFAAAGSAVGLGNLWRFSYEAGNNGGGLFVLIYLVAVLVIGLPILLAELSMGRHSQRDTVGAFEAIKPGTSFKIVGYLGFTAAVMILSFYVVIAGQTLGYIYKSVSGEFQKLSDTRAVDGLTGRLENLLGQIQENGGENRAKKRERLRAFLQKENLWKEGTSPQESRLLALAAGLVEKQGEKHQSTDWETLRKEIRIQWQVRSSEGIYSRFVGQKPLQLVLVVLFVALTVFIVSRGISGGIERFTRVFMPVLLVILVIMIVRALTLPGSWSGLAFYLSPKFSDLSPGLVISAIGQAFFSLSLGMGTMITYGSYVSKREKLPQSAGMIAAFDTSIAIFAGFIVFPVIFSLGMAPDQGAGGIFQVLPILFSQIPLGGIFGLLFFLLLSIAALTSTISLLEVPVAHMVDHRRWKRRKAAWILGGVSLLFALPCSLSDSFFGFWNTVWGSFALTIGGLLISIFVGWIWKPQEALKEIRLGKLRFPWGRYWAFGIRYLIPLFITAVLISNLLEIL